MSKRILKPKAVPRQPAPVLLIFRARDIVTFRRPDGRIFIGCVMATFPEQRRVQVWNESVELKDVVARVDSITRPQQPTPAELIPFPMKRPALPLVKGGAR